MPKAPTFARLPGFRDFPPEDLAVRSHIFDAWRRVSRRYGFLEYDAPPLEALDLYVEKSGDEIVGQLYNFVDKGGRDVSLRPEMTPSLARVLADRSRSLPKPIRWFTIPQLFRYERQQRGRLREHFQWNVDVVGEADAGADAEVLAVAIDGLRELGLGSADFVARLSDRRLVSAILEGLGVSPADVPACLAIVDKLTRTPADALEGRLAREGGLTPALARAVLEVFAEGALESVDDRYGGLEGVEPVLTQVRSVLDRLESMGLSEYVEFDLRIVRGLAYYTGTVFELFDRAGELRAICGGGRYDRLLDLVGGESLPAVGFGMGDVVLGELLSDRELLPSFDRELDVFLVTIGEEAGPVALGLAHRLRDAGRRVAYSLRNVSVRKQFSQASTEGAREVWVLGPDEIERGVVVIRDMGSGEEREAPLAEVMDAGGEAS